MSTKAIREQDLRKGIEVFAAELERLAPIHYHLTAEQLLGRLDTDEGRLQYARLIGVIVKGPFADEVARTPSRATQSFMDLRWKDKPDLKKAYHSWQFGLVKCMANNFGDPKKISDQLAVGFLEREGRFETNLSKSLFRAFHNGICGNKKTSKAVADAIKRAKAEGVNLTDPTATGLSVGVASIVAVAIAPLLPAALVVVAAPVLGGMALFLLHVGIEGFCEWSRESGDALRTAEEETEKKQPATNQTQRKIRKS